jgi:quercetin dioxygenase-like cupin family protein
MKIFDINNFTRGWYIGNFEPSIFRQSNFEVGLLSHKKSEHWPAHYHKIATEFNLLVSGSMEINGVLINPGQIFILEPGEVANPIFLEDCKIVVVKAPSIPSDKYNV